MRATRALNTPGTCTGFAVQAFRSSRPGEIIGDMLMECVPFRSFLYGVSRAGTAARARLLVDLRRPGARPGGPDRLPGLEQHLSPDAGRRPDRQAGQGQTRNGKG